MADKLYLHNLETSTAISVEGVGGMETLNQVGELITSILGPADLSGSYASPTTPDTRAERQHPT